MEDTSSIYWTLMETDTDNSELYFPPDTPVGGANPKKLYSLYQKRHARQKERLIKLQVAELYKYRENFSTDFKDDNSLNTPSTVCELISDSLERLQKSDISSIPREVLIELDPKRYDRKRYSSSPESAHNDRRRYKDGSNREPIYTSSLSTSSSLTQLKQPPVVSIVGIPANARPPTVISSSTTATPNKSDPPTLKNSSFKSPAKPLKVSASSINKSGPPTVHSSNPRLPTAGSSVTHISTARPPAMIPSSVNKSGPPTVHFSPIRPPPTVQFSSFKSTGRPPSVGSSSAIGVPSNSKVPTFNLQFKNPAYNNVPPYIAQPSSQFTQPNDMKYNEHRSYTPLFTPRPPRKIETLLDKGSLLIYNKPCRVLIRQPNGTAKAYGNPKDYDDAIHSRTTRPDNPVYKRHMNGADYLFYKTDSGNVVTIGSVSKIQPLIHKYFLSV
ncbi:hypothetical protein INT48_009187 [Thamnidium elegans]|uniref:Uncharacterized protein n=1 Tax=Thamnidium elegans TaxID=101142 RepID=A0A8H7SJZ9_9FUNG|nr:hypothetical protein INT48_009187 [Thamnidium elegans]